MKISLLFLIFISVIIICIDAKTTTKKPATKTTQKNSPKTTTKKIRTTTTKPPPPPTRVINQNFPKYYISFFKKNQVSQIVKTIPNIACNGTTNGTLFLQTLATNLIGKSTNKQLEQILKIVKEYKTKSNDTDHQETFSIFFSTFFQPFLDTANKTIGRVDCETTILSDLSSIMTDDNAKIGITNGLNAVNATYCKPLLKVLKDSVIPFDNLNIKNSDDLCPFIPKAPITVDNTTQTYLFLDYLKVPEPIESNNTLNKSTSN